MEWLATSEMMAEVTERVDPLADFEAVSRLYQPRIFRFILASLREVDAAETLTQDCLLKAHLSRSRFRNECSVETWLLQIAINLVRDYSRNRRLQFWKRTKATSKPVDALQELPSNRERSPERNVLLNEEIRAVWNAADTLSERQRTVFLLRFVEDMDLLEIAAATGMKEGTVKVHLFRALQAIRLQLGGTR